IKATSADKLKLGSLDTQGSIFVTGTLHTLSVGSLAGSLTAGHINNLSALNVPVTPTVFNITEGGVTRRLVISPAVGTALPQLLSYYFDDAANGTPEIAVQLTNGNGASYDVSLVSSSNAPGGKFDLSYLGSAVAGAAGVH